MYCVNCGVKLADTEKVCPLCATEVFHPTVHQGPGEPRFPQKDRPAPKSGRWAAMLVLTAAYLLPMLIVLMCDVRLNRAVTWSGMVIGAMLLGYEILLLPLWFRTPNPIIFVPCGFGAAGLYLLYLSLVTGGGWFLGFAFPVLGVLGLIVCAVVCLCRCLRRGKLYVVGGATLALGVFMPALELLIGHNFARPFVGWSLYPAVALVLLGAVLLFLAICRPAREAMERKLFF